MTRSFVMTVDVEIDAGRKWKTRNPASYRGVTEGIERIQAVCDRYGVPPVYFVSPAVLVDAASVEVLRALDPRRSELGAHLHGEYIGPEAKYPGPDFSGCDPGEMQCAYPPSLERAKLENLTDAFAQAFGRRPRSFRAGRFAARGWTIECLQQLGYTHDASVTPHRNWHDVADFSRPGPLSPYHPSFDDICRVGESTVIEVPVSITPELKWLRPTPKFSDLARCLEVIDWYEANVAPTVLCCMIHNVEVVPDMSPYCRTEEDCAALLGRIDAILAALAARGYEFKTLAQITLAG